MPHLHGLLRHGIDFDSIEAAPEDAVEYVQDDGYNAEQRAAKRRRIESIASQYLRGRRPMILSATLKGPFNQGWNNPWAKGTRPEPKKMEVQQGNSRNRRNGKTTSKQGLRKGNETAGKTPLVQPTFSLPPPEQVELADNMAEAPPLSMPSATRDNSRSTEFFSANTDRPTTDDAPNGNPHWLRRPATRGRALVGQHKGMHNDSSPTRTRDGRRPLDAQGELQLPPPKLPIATVHSSPAQTKTPDIQWRSGASASMVFSSPVKPVSSVPSARIASPLKRKRSPPPMVTERTANEDFPPTSEGFACASGSSAASGDTGDGKADVMNRPETPRYAQSSSLSTEPVNFEKGSTPASRMMNSLTSTRNEPVPDPLHTRPQQHRVDHTNSFIVHLPHADTAILEGYHSAKKLAQQAIEQVRTPTVRPRHPSREEIRQCAERCTLHSRVHTNAKGAKKSKPRTMTFSSPVTVRKEAQKAEAQQDITTPADLRSVETDPTRSRRPDVYDVPESEPDGQQQQQQQDLRSSRHSNYSTQTAMMLAQQEFQEGTFPSAIHTDTPGPSHPVQEDTPQQEPAISSFEVTPFHAFNKGLDRLHLAEGPHNAPISTQDLFNAASPFAFSTMKKATKTRRSGLRFAVYPHSQEEGAANVDNGPKSPKSPIPSGERSPLKERNSKVSFRSTASEKASQESTSQEPTLLSRRDVNLSQLSLGDLSSNGDLNFVERFLSNLDDMT